MTERIDRLVAAKEAIPAALLAFDLDDLDDLRARAADPGRADCVRAIEILAQVVPVEALAPAAAVLAAGDPGRAAAALDAIVPADEAAIPLALAAAVAQDEVVARAAWLTLQQVGRSAALPALATAALATVPDAQPQAAFAQSVIACRAGLTGYELADPTPDRILDLAPGEDARVIEISPATDPDFAILSGMFTPQTYLLALTQAATKTMTCAGVDMLLALDSNVLLAGPSTLLQGPSLLAIVGVLDPFHVTCSVGLLVFTRPDGAGGIRVTVHDPGGTVIYAGAGATSGDAITLEVRTVASPGAATVAIKGVLTSAGLEITDARSATRVSPLTPKTEPSTDLDG